mgnify:CR=1 FL=1
MKFPYNQTMLMQYAVTGNEKIVDAGVEMTKGIQETNVTFTAKQGVTKEDDSWKNQDKKRSRKPHFLLTKIHREKRESCICNLMWKMDIRTGM